MMTRLSIVIALLLCFSFALPLSAATCTSPCVAATGAGAPGSVTTSGINTTGANFLVVTVNCYNLDPSSVAPTDNKSNTANWTHGTSQLTGSGEANTVIWYYWNANVGSGHTVTYNPGGAHYCAVTFAAYSGVSISGNPLDKQNGVSSAGSQSSCTAGSSITPTMNGELVISTVGGGGGGSSISFLMVSAGIIVGVIQDYVSSNNEASAQGYLSQSAAAAINPAWSNLILSDGVACATASFFASSPAGSITQIGGFLVGP
jgi:hypothetical protein